MKSEKIFLKAMQDAGLSKSDIGRALGVTPQSAGKTIRAPGVSVNSAVKILNVCGYNLYAVPESVRLDQIITNAMEITTDNASMDSAGGHEGGAHKER